MASPATISTTGSSLGTYSGTVVFQSAFVRSVAGISADAVIEEQHHDELVLTDHPVETGSSITDHAYLLPYELTVTYAWGMASSQNTNQSLSFLNDLYTQFRALQASRTIFIVYTGRRIYKNMMLQSISLTTDKDTENAMVLRLVCREVILVSTTLVTSSVSSDPSVQANPGSTQPATQKGVVQLGPGSSAATINATTPSPYSAGGDTLVNALKSAFGSMFSSGNGVGSN